MERGKAEKREIIMYRLDTENFLLEFDLMITDFSFLLDMGLDIKVIRYGFSVNCMMDIDAYGLAGSQ